MRNILRPAAALLAVLTAILVLISCGGPSSTAPEKGTPAFYWAAAKETWAAGDVDKTREHLDKILATENEYTKRAQPWFLILTSGLARGYADLAQHYEIGGRNNKADPSSFRKQTSQTRNMAGRLGLQFAEVFAKFQATKDESIALEFVFPTGSAVPVTLLSTKVAKGVIMPQAEVDQVQQRALQRGVLLTLSQAVGAPDDSARAQEMFKAGNVKVARPVFVLAMAGELYALGQLYTRDKMDEPQKMELFCARAQEALKIVPESKESKALNTKIQVSLKTRKK
jgi:hypothetical protein